jgi:hypothetical protein
MPGYQRRDDVAGDLGLKFCDAIRTSSQCSAYNIK